MATVRKIVYLGCPVLRKTASPVESVAAPGLADLMDDMTATLVDAGGVGIAAPQVDVSLRLFIVASSPNPRYPDAPEIEATAMINPEIISYSPEIVRGWEGCLSVPGLRGLVPRSHSIIVRYTTREGTLEECEFAGFAARICQHEYDHLNGLAYLDRLESTKDLVSEAWYQQVLTAQRQACLV